MKKLLIVIVVATALTFSIDSIWKGNGIDEAWVLRSAIEKAEMKEFTDSLFGYTITYPDFLKPSTENRPGCNRFCYYGRTEIIIETRVVESIDECKSHADKISYRDNALIITGKYYEHGCTYENMRYHMKAIRSAKRWAIYAVIYDKKYEESIQRIIDRIDSWKTCSVAMQPSRTKKDEEVELLFL